MIEVKNVSKVFKKPVRGDGLWQMVKSLFSRKYTQTVAVNNVSFTIQDGEAVGYIGANGAGKSTTIKMMSGILTPTSGTITIDGKSPHVAKERNGVLKNIGVVFGQRTQLWWDLPLSDTFELLKEIYEVPQAEYDERFAYLKSVFGLDDFLSDPVRTLSLGQRMRADLAAALIHNPKVLFLDEPTIGLDVVVKKRLIDAIENIRAKFNTTLILTTHDISDIERLCNRVIIIDEGRVIYDGTVEGVGNAYGDVRNLIFSTSDNVDESAFVNNFGEAFVSLEHKDGLYTLTIDAEKIHIDKVLGFCLANFAVDDVKLRETSIEQVVAKIYESKKVE